MEMVSSLEIRRWQRFMLGASMFLVTAAMGFLQPFVPLYMAAAKLTSFQIGLVIGTGTGFALLIQPLMGRLSDHFDSRRPLMAAAAILSGSAYLSYRGANGLLAFTLLTAVGVNGTMYLGTVGAVLVGRMAGQTGQGGAMYARYRVWGSIGYILVSLLTGWLLNHQLRPHAALGRQQLDTVFTYGPLLFFAIAVISVFVPDRKRPLVVSDTPNTPEERPPISQNLRIFLISFFLYQFALYGASAYLSLYLKSLHATPVWTTSVFAAGVVCEVLVMTRIGRFSDVYGRRPAMAVAFFILPLRLLLYIPARTPLWVLVVQSMHGLNYGIMGAIAIVFVNDTATDQDRGRAQARLAVVAGLASAIGPLLCGWIAQHFGIRWMFAVMAVIGAAGAALFKTRVRESHPTPKALPEEVPAYMQPILRLLASPPLD